MGILAPKWQHPVWEKLDQGHASVHVRLGIREPQVYTEITQGHPGLVKPESLDTVRQ